jgi:hypothetical protein
MAVLYTPHFIQFFDDNGDPLANGKLYTYTAGTTTPKSTYTTAAATVANANPIVLDSAGRAVAFLDGSYKFRLETSASVLVRETDNVSAFTTSAVTIDSILPSQTGNAGKFLGTDGISASWTAGGGGIVYLGTATASASATLDFTSLLNSTNYTAYMFVFNNILPSSSGAGMLFRTSTNNGSSWDNSAGNYSYTGANLGSTYSGTGNNSDTDGHITSSVGIDTTVSNNSLNGYAFLYVGASKYTYMDAFTNYLSTTNTVRPIHVSTCRLTTTEVNAIRFLMDAGNIISGTIRLYGVQKS